MPWFRWIAGTAPALIEFKGAGREVGSFFVFAPERDGDPLPGVGWRHPIHPLECAGGTGRRESVNHRDSGIRSSSFTARTTSTRIAFTRWRRRWRCSNSAVGLDLPVGDRRTSRGRCRRGEDGRERSTLPSTAARTVIPITGMVAPVTCWGVARHRRANAVQRALRRAQLAARGCLARADPPRDRTVVRRRARSLGSE